MTNSYFNHSSPVARHTRVRAEAVNAIASAIAAGFDMLPSPTQLQNAGLLFATDTGSANSVVVAMPIEMTAYNDGAFIIVKIAATNTGAATINIDGLGARAIKTIEGNDPSAGDLVVGDYVGFICDESNTRWLISTFRRSILTDIAASVAAIEAVFIGSYANDAAADASGKTITEGTTYYKNTATKGLRIYRDGAWATSIGDASLYALLSGATFTGTLEVRDIQEDKDALSGTTPTLSVTAAQVFTLTTSGNTTVAISDTPSGIAWCRTLFVTLGGSHTLAITSADWGDRGTPSGLSSGDKIKIQLDGIGSTFQATEIWRSTA